MKPTQLFVAVFLSLLIFACGGGGGGTTPPPQPAPVLTSIAVSSVATTYVAGTQSSVTVTGTYSNGQTAVLSGISWVSSNPGVASINASGLLTALSEGVTTLSASIGNQTASAAITIIAPSLTSIEITSAATSVPAGLTIQFSARGTFNNGATQTLNDASWLSSSPSIASVSSTGLAQGVSAGSVTISAQKDGISANVAVTVSAAALQAINVQVTNANPALGTSTAAQAFGSFTDNTTRGIAVTWVSSNDQVVTLDDQGVITTVGIGQATISASANNITSNSATITVSDAVVVSIDTSPMFSSIPLGMQRSTSATLLFSDNTTQAATSTVWVSSNPSIASVTSASGVVTITSLALGNVTITASASGFSSSFDLTMVDAVVTGIAFNTDGVTLPQGADTALSVIATLSNNATMNVSGSSAFTLSPNTLGTFTAPTDESVMFTAVTQGTGLITAQFNTLTTTVPVEVTAAVPVALVTNQQSITVAAGLSTTASLMVAFSDGSEITPQTAVTWTVDDNTVVSISATGTGMISITGLQQGDTTITGALNGLSLMFTVEVSAAQPVSLAFVLPTVYVDDSNIQLTATMLFTDNSTANVTEQVVWSSAQPTIASVSNAEATAGILTPLNEGDVDITASFGDGTISASLSTTILQPRILSGFLSVSYNVNTEITIGEGDHAIKFRFTDIDNQSVTLAGADGALVAAINTAASIDQVTDASGLVFGTASIPLTQNTSSAFASVRNSNNVNAVIHVHEVKSFGNGNSGNLVMFSWAIRSDGGSNYAKYMVTDAIKLFQCEEPAAPGRPGSCNELGFSYSASTSASDSRTPVLAQYNIASFVLVAIGRSYTVTNVQATEASSIVSPTFNGISNNLVLNEGDGASFFLSSPPTGDQVVMLTYRFNIDNNASRSFTLMATFRTQ